MSEKTISAGCYPFSHDCLLGSLCKVCLAVEGILRLTNIDLCLEDERCEADDTTVLALRQEPRNYTTTPGLPEGAAWASEEFFFA